MIDMKSQEIQEIIEEIEQINNRLQGLIKGERKVAAKEIMADASDALEDAASCLKSL